MKNRDLGTRHSQLDRAVFAGSGRRFFLSAVDLYQ
jgi:hypothetical protein